MLITSFARQTPTLRREAPTLGREAPTLSREAPTSTSLAGNCARTRAPVSKLHCIENVKMFITSFARKAPTLKREAPTLGREAPTLSREAPTPKSLAGNCAQTRAQVIKLHCIENIKMLITNFAGKTPTSRREAPTLSREAPTLSREAPTPKSLAGNCAQTRAQVSKSHCIEMCFIYKTPTLTRETPTLKREAPTLSREAPTLSREAPTPKSLAGNCAQTRAQVSKSHCIEILTNLVNM